MHQAENFIITVYGERWLDAVIPLQILCLSSIIASVSWTNSILFNAKGRPDLNFKFSLCSLPFLAILIGYMSRWGIIGVAGAMTIMRVMNFIMVFFCLKTLNAKLSEYMRPITPAFISSILMLLSLSALNILVDPAELLIPVLLILNIFVGACVYIASYYYFFRSSFNDYLDFAKQIFLKK
jgi:O-antigen/teichoic acid export membrane protein